MLKLCCPECRAPLDVADYSCANGHQFVRDQHGVLPLVSAEFQHSLNAFTSAFQKLRSAENKRLLDPAAYAQLPFGQDGAAWRVRQYDLAIVQKLLAHRPRLRILEIGAWNGWLTHHLAAWGHEVVAIGEFSEPFDGLGAESHYAETWQTIQMNTADLSLFSSRFDVVILNRCVAFFEEPTAYLRQAAGLIDPGGLLVATGLGFYKNTAQKQAEVSADSQHFSAHNAIPFRHYKGYLDAQDAAQFRTDGVALFSYPQWRMRLGELKELFRPNRPSYKYALYQVESS